MTGFFRKENSTLIIMIFIGILFIVGIILRWDYISTEASGAFKNIFQRDTTHMTHIPDTQKGE